MNGPSFEAAGEDGVSVMPGARSLTDAEREQEERDWAELEQMSRDLAGLQQSPWQPRCVVEAFAEPEIGRLQFTMTTWLRLERTRSPLLVGEWPKTPEEIDAAYTAFDLERDTEETSGEAIALTLQEMLRTIDAAFQMGISMKEPEKRDKAEQPPDNGFGAWLGLYACLVTQCHVSPAEAKAMPVGEVQALICAMRGNQGWYVIGETYALRDMPEQRGKMADTTAN